MSAPRAGFVSVDGERYYRIPGYDRLPPFLMSIPSDSDLWMFLASSGGLAAGRGDADGSLFPYETVDKLYDGHHISGPITLIRVRRPGGGEALWEPFASGEADPGIRRTLYKNVPGNRVLFEEVHAGLGLVFRARWSAADAFGHVRTATLSNRGPTPVSVDVLDGFRNVLPYGAPVALYQQSSSLVDAYKRTEIDEATGLGIVSLTSRIHDRAEPAEELRANVVWCRGPESMTVHLEAETVEWFRAGRALSSPAVVTGRRGNYLVSFPIDLAPEAGATWHLVADVGQSHLRIAELRSRLASDTDLPEVIEGALDAATEGLVRIVARADGLQRTGYPEASVHHFANVLFNCMRGGVFPDNYDLRTEDLIRFIQVRNRPVSLRQADFLSALPAVLAVEDLRSRVGRTGDPDLERLILEYLPLHFSRRHGDPSRPWNRFSIPGRNPDGSPVLGYEGNWRDIFQNWEALGESFPRFLSGFIATFVNASTADGFNPYRIGREGIDWEVPDPGQPWSHIGYWGDHQIVYLLKLLEALARHAPGRLEGLLAREIFTYADVPYRIVPYAEIVADPRETILYDQVAAARTAARVAQIGNDGKLLTDAGGGVHHVTLLEKLLVPVLSKLSNLVPGGGIWMNTQRPEWNDANNALVGNGLSMVTLGYLRRYLGFLEDLLGSGVPASIPVSVEVRRWFLQVREALGGPEDGTDRARKRFLDAVGTAFSTYRDAVYSRGSSGAEPMPVEEIRTFCREARTVLDRTLRAGRRDDGLYHAYNILQFTADGTGCTVHPLYEMLEGQVSVLSSGLLDTRESAELLEALFASRLVRPDQDSFLLYPERELPGFLERNVVPEARALAVPLLGTLLEQGETSILAGDAFGVLRFHPDLANRRDLERSLDALGAREEFRAMVERDRAAVAEVYEATFRHRTFTGRSGVMYGYEGLGSVYWHMVAKLLLAVQEVILHSARAGEPEATRASLVEGYYRIRKGLGFEKTPEAYGAFPTDPYSHTPAHRGAQQPGMTGQVKEEILTRFGEFGIRVEEGTVTFRPVLLLRREFRAAPGRFRTIDVNGRAGELDLEPGSLGFTYCQVPVIYRLIGEGTPSIRIVEAGGSVLPVTGVTLDAVQSARLFDRTGEIARIEVEVPESSVLDLRDGSVPPV